MKLALLVILSVAAGIKCSGDAVESSSSSAALSPSSEQLTASNVQVEDNGTCGRRKFKQTELTAGGVDPKSGYWPWHVIVNRLQRKVYGGICGGTLVSKSWVLTAAHCLTLEEKILKPYSFRITMGNYYSYLHPISDLVVHDDFKTTSLENDIALLKLTKEATLDDYIQPACVWHDKISEKLSSGDVYGNVVEWIFGGKDDPHYKLRDATALMVPETTCVKSNPMFYKKIVDDKKFCAGLSNDTATWYGDDGSGFYVFVPDNDEGSSGAWYVRGILSQRPSIESSSSDPHQYAVFTDVAKYEQWIQKYVQ